MGKSTSYGERLLLFVMFFRSSSALRREVGRQQRMLLAVSGFWFRKIDSN